MLLSRPGETLEKHIEKVISNYNTLCKNKQVNKILNNIYTKINTKEELNNILQPDNLILDVLRLHDKGKENKYFQSYVGNKDYLDYKFTSKNKEHSLLGSYYFLEYYKDKIDQATKALKGRNKIKTKGKLNTIILACAYIISKHHGDIYELNTLELLENIEDKYSRNPDCFKNYNQDIIDFYKRSKPLESINYELYLFIKMIYAILITCDYMAVLEFTKQRPLTLNLINNLKLRQFKANFEDNDIVKGIRNISISAMTTINKYRTQMFLESELNLEKINSSMYYLEAPTGSGKSITSLNLALNMLDETYNKVYYVAPFINILEQTYRDVNNILGNFSIKDIALINSKESIITEDCDIYEEEYLSSQMINYPISIISHVKLFDILFSNKRRHNLMLPLLCNSVIILDEIQSYKNSIWIDIINSLKEYSDAFNIKIIIMSATLPKLDLLLDDKNYTISNLIDNKKYYYDFFKTRCNCDFSMLHKEHSHETLYNKINEVINNTSENKRILIGLITVKTCNEIYKEMLKYINQGYEVYKITSNTNSLKRLNIISKLREKKDGKYKLNKVILVATQCIEAGVDIDMNIGFKNISLLDSDEQFMGRIERNFINTGIVYYFKIDNLGLIYKDDYRSERTLLNREWQQLLENKDFDKFYERNYRWLLENESEGHLNNLNHYKNLSFYKLYENLKLINDNTKVNVILEYDYMHNGKVISYTELSKEYYKLKFDSNISYGEREIKLSKLKKQLNIFNYSFNTYDIDKINCLEMKDGNYHVSNASRFFDNITDANIITNESELNTDRLLAS